MRLFLFGVLGALWMTLACSESFEQPSVKAGDTWIYRTTTEKGPAGWTQGRDEFSVARVTPSTIYFTVKPSGSSQPPREFFASPDRARMRDINGKETLVNKPLSFPLSTGKSWDVQYTEDHPNRTYRSMQWKTTYTVTGTEPVEVPAGKFQAMKIEAEGRWTGQLEPGQSVVQAARTAQDNTTMVTQVKRTAATPLTGRVDKAFWYVPETKRWVKSVEEYYGSNGVRNERYTAELESFKAAQ